MNHEDVEDDLQDTGSERWRGGLDLVEEKLEGVKGHTLSKIGKISGRRIEQKVKLTRAMRQHKPSATRPFSRMAGSLRFTAGIIRSPSTPSRVEFSSKVW